MTEIVVRGMQVLQAAGLRENDEFIPRSELLAELNPFAALFDNRPIQDLSGGVGLLGSFSLYQLLKRLRPEAVIESGVWRGHTTWMIEQACPDAKLYCFDPRVAAMQDCFQYISKSANYFADDFGSTRHRALVEGQRTTAFFDDHQDALERLSICYARGIRDVIFDDNYFAGGGHVSLFGYARTAAAEVLRGMIEFTYVFPTSFKWELDTSDGPTLLDMSEKEKYDLYFRARSGYRFMTYCRLKASS